MPTPSKFDNIVIPPGIYPTGLPLNVKINTYKKAEEAKWASRGITHPSTLLTAPERPSKAIYRLTVNGVVHQEFVTPKSLGRRIAFLYKYLGTDIKITIEGIA